MKARTITRALLRSMPLPALDDDGDKTARGRVLVVGSSTRVPGAILLSGVAALRAGAGTLQMATVAPIAIPLGLAVPEALVIALPSTRSGEIAVSRTLAPLRRLLEGADAVLVGPGMLGGRAAQALLAGLLRRVKATSTVVIDAAALESLRRRPRLLAPLDGRAVLTPHAGEMAAMLGVGLEEVETDPPAFARQAAVSFGAVVALKGAESWIAHPDGTLLRYRGGKVGLATSGSGDTLAGIIAGLAARGAAPRSAAAWGVWAHGSAGNALTRRMGPVGFLARELLAEVPRMLRAGTG